MNKLKYNNNSSCSNNNFFLQIKYKIKMNKKLENKFLSQILTIVIISLIKMT